MFYVIIRKKYMIQWNQEHIGKSDCLWISGAGDPETRSGDNRKNVRWERKIKICKKQPSCPVVWQINIIKWHVKVTAEKIC